MGTGQLSFAFDVRPAMDQEDFLVAPCNEDAVAWIDAWPDWPGRALCLYGSPGCGKSHLAHVWRSRSGAVEVAADGLDSAAVGDLSAEVKCCVVEDAYPVADETALFHLFNTIIERRGYLLLTAERPPSRWDIGLKDLRSRLLAVPSQEIGLPDEGLLGAVMIKMFADRQIDVSHDVLVYLVMRIERSFDGARRVVDALDRAALAAHRRLTVPLARDVLKDLGMA
ncbi:MAG: DnaA/Hda family protein [Pseudomonadota bacterium]